ncbi:secretoglobin family 2B member 20-like [Mus caroli]|uniref:ABPBG21a n=1 Tax=Mus caroli TaxID=10089 RepID=A0A6M4RS82_MUSCR|nr:secretoglobin family 2B member 20-like [Mus caroli]QJS38984.1 ABPBG21a [Mus caroli]
MKGTLLLLGLLVTGGLIFQTTEACVPFFEGYASVVSGSRVWMYQELQAFNATAEEKVAFEKIQGCYREESLRNRLLEPKIMEAMVAGPEWQQFYTDGNVITPIVELIDKQLGQ